MSELRSLSDEYDPFVSAGGFFRMITSLSCVILERMRVGQLAATLDKTEG